MVEVSTLSRTDEAITVPEGLDVGRKGNRRRRPIPPEPRRARSRSRPPRRRAHPRRPPWDRPRDTRQAIPRQARLIHRVNISETFSRRPIATALMMLAVLVFGIERPTSCYRWRHLPSVDFPTITVSAQLPGASPTPWPPPSPPRWSSSSRRFPDLQFQMTSTSGLGSTSITLQFDTLPRHRQGAAPGHPDCHQARPAVCCRSTLPNPPTYRKTNPADRPVLIYAIHSAMTCRSTRSTTYASTILAQKLSTISGVSQVIVAGQAGLRAPICRSIPWRWPRCQGRRARGRPQTLLPTPTLDQAKGTLEGHPADLYP